LVGMLSNQTPKAVQFSICNIIPCWNRRGYRELRKKYHFTCRPDLQQSSDRNRPRAACTRPFSREPSCDDRCRRYDRMQGAGARPADSGSAHVDLTTEQFGLRLQRRGGCRAIRTWRDLYLSLSASEAVSTSGEKTYSRMRWLPVAISTVTVMPGLNSVRSPSIIM
jgi:hypothetical protein